MANRVTNETPFLRWRRFQFGLRTLLLLMLLLGMAPWGLVQYQRWREARLWSDYHTAREQRDELLNQWRLNYAAMIKNAQTQSTAEASVREAYLTARREVEEKWQALQTRHESPVNLEAVWTKFRNRDAEPPRSAEN